jgi:ribosomal protein L19
MFEERRASDEKLNELISLVKEIHQRQIERTIPAVESLEKVIYGNGKPGLCDRVSVIETSLTSVKWFGGVVIALLSSGLLILEFIFKHK